MKFTTMIATLTLAVIAAALTVSAQTSPFKLQSSDIAPQSTIAPEQVFDGFGCNGKNISPALRAGDG